MLDRTSAMTALSTPEEEDLINAQVFVNLGQTLKDYDRIWTEVKAH